jgi:CRP-like cAMP-binding protein
LSGEAYGVKYDVSGREIIYNQFPEGSIFGDVLAVSSSKESPVTIITYPGTVLLKFRFDKLVSSSGGSHELRARLLKNLTAELANKFFGLQDRVNCLVSPTLRDKITVFLENEARKQKSRSFTVSLNRERLAAYLNTDRSALSRELSYMKKDGIIDFDKNKFTLLI